MPRCFCLCRVTSTANQDDKANPKALGISPGHHSGTFFEHFAFNPGRKDQSRRNSSQASGINWIGQSTRGRQDAYSERHFPSSFSNATTGTSCVQSCAGVHWYKESAAHELPASGLSARATLV